MTEAEQDLWQSAICDDRKFTLQQIKQQSTKTLPERLLELQQFSRIESREFEWARQLTCLRILPRRRQNGGSTAKPTLQEVKANIFEEDRFGYVAVSYCCQTSECESGAAGAYRVRKGHFEPPRFTIVRDIVIRRVIKFTLHNGLRDFWIDEECLDKADIGKKQEAIRGMDLVYRNCTCAVGVLSCRFEDIEDIKVLDQFLQGKFVHATHKRKTLNLTSRFPDQVFERLRKVLGTIFEDSWWDRCWIFQEGYCSGGMMKLLIQHSTSGPQLMCLQKVEEVNGDIQFDLATLQTQSTRFCLAIELGDQNRFMHFRQLCDDMLSKARRYSTLYEHQNWMSRKTGKLPMSATIIDDVCKRHLAVKTDVLDIIANCCNYPRRIQLPLFTSGEHSLSLAVLAIFLINGDLLADCSSVKASDTMTVPDLLMKLSLGQSTMPINVKPLTFLKRRRLSQVELLPQGIKTLGHIWRVDRKITLKYRPSWRFENYHTTDLLTESEICCLKQLASILRRSFPDLSMEIFQFLQVPAGTSNYSVECERLMCTMAETVCQAIKKGRTLLLGALEGTDTYGAVFVSHHSKPKLPMNIMTSWERNNVLEQISNLRTVEKYISVQIVPDLGDNTEDFDYHETRVWVPKDWVNGLCFFQGVPKQDVLLSWPKIIIDN